MSEREIVLDEPIMDDQAVALQHAVDRAERAEAELAKLKHASTAKAPAPQSEPATAHTSSASKASHQGASNDGLSDSMSPAPPEVGHARINASITGIDALREDPMMAHLLDSLEAGKDIGHYGRLVFAMIARHFLSDDEVIAELTRDRDFDETKAVTMLRQVEGRDYSPPRRERILEWQAQQEFPILPNPDDPDSGNVYRSLVFPQKTYDHIEHYQEEKMQS